jgi:methyl-accepting chemotaxis protein
VVFAVVALALLLAIAFFYLTNDHRADRQADKVTQAASSVDDATRVVGEAARNAADRLRNDH